MALTSEQLRSYLMQCELESMTPENYMKLEQISIERYKTEKYWRDRIAAENQINQ